MAQLGDLPRARTLLRAAARAFGPREIVARARCIVAEAEVALASRDLGWSAQGLERARATLEARGDVVNAAHARYVEVRRLLLIGRVEEADRMLAAIEPEQLPPALQAVHHLMLAGIALRRVRAGEARDALAYAEHAARAAGIPALAAEVESAWLPLRATAARLVAGGSEQPLLLADVERVFASGALVIDACRRVVRMGGTVASLTTRPVLFALARALGEAWPGDAPRDVLIARAFGSRFNDDSHRARLRVEVARLRTALRPLADVSATRHGFALSPRGSTAVVVLAQPVEHEHAAVLACLADGESWSSSALALALGTSQRSVQRALDALAETGKVQSFGRGRARRWITPPVPGFTTALLLPATLPTE
jgi:hypothetical protein